MTGMMLPMWVGALRAAAHNGYEKARTRVSSAVSTFLYGASTPNPTDDAADADTDNHVAPSPPDEEEPRNGVRLPVPRGKRRVHQVGLFLSCACPRVQRRVGHSCGCVCVSVCSDVCVCMHIRV
eukprot:GHVU01190535.1.p2 GENE.GHVU01190535.1~~GHVU01190535.1.p2  ORF type:complete len:124 (-),score=6.70 GHVU01190535.1:104-475(-)